MKLNYRFCRAGFTLIELLVVIAIIAILAGM
ncbi:MAG: type IV pilin protein, partial [Limisphaerales bacterium]